MNFCQWGNSVYAIFPEMSNTLDDHIFGTEKISTNAKKVFLLVLMQFHIRQ